MASEKSQKPIDDQLYYHGLLPREDIPSMLKQNGDFLVRTSEPTAGQPRCFVLSVMYDEKLGEIKHYCIKYLNGDYVINRHACSTVPILVKFHIDYKESIDRDLHVLIKKPINRCSWELSHDDIEITKKLGQGAFGEVSMGRVMIKGIKHDCAIKQAKLESMNKKQIKEIMREARLMRMFDHPNVVKLYGVAAGREPLMIVMELADKGSLDTYLQKNELPVKDRLKMCMGAARGVEHLHTKWVIHRDIAARNCLFGDGKVKISDFGMARQLREGTVYKTSENSRVPIRWVAPETLRTREYSQKTDTYAFGILCWEILMHGIEPYPGMMVAEVSTRVKDGYRMPMPPDCPKDMWKIVVDYCWTATPNKRWTMKNVVKKLEHITGLSRRGTSGAR